jgi:DNA-binding transcriptional LysR family regulator
VVLADFEPPPAPVHVVHAEGRRVAARVRTFVDFAAQRLRANEALG